MSKIEWVSCGNKGNTIKGIFSVWRVGIGQQNKMKSRGGSIEYKEDDSEII